MRDGGVGYDGFEGYCTTRTFESVLRLDVIITLSSRCSYVITHKLYIRTYRDTVHNVTQWSYEVYVAITIIINMIYDTQVWRVCAWMQLYWYTKVHANAHVWIVCVCVCVCVCVRVHTCMCVCLLVSVDIPGVKDNK